MGSGEACRRGDLAIDAAIDRYPTERVDFTKKLVWGPAGLARQAADEALLDPSVATTAQPILARIPE